MKIGFLRTVAIVIFIGIIILYAFFSRKTMSGYDKMQGVARWRTVYEELEYCFEASVLFNGALVPKGANLSEENLKQRILPFLNVVDSNGEELKNYKYKKLNGKDVRADYLYAFNDLFMTKTGMIMSIKKNPDLQSVSYEYEDENTGKEDNYSAVPLFYMMIDINGRAKPNKIGLDVFFINIYSHGIKAAGYGISGNLIRTNCSPVASGVYCSKYYLVGGKF